MYISRNCAFHVPGHRALLSPEYENVRVPPSTIEAPGIDILPYILLPLAGPEEFDLDVRINMSLLPSSSLMFHHTTSYP